MRKHTIKIAAIALLSAFALTACSDDIIAKPDGYDDKNSPVLTIDGFDGEIYNNEFTDIYDYIREGTLPQDVLNELLYKYASTILGTYNKVTRADGSEETTLKEAVAGLTRDAEGNVTGGNEKTNEFIKNHSAYWTKNKQGRRVNASYEQLSDDEEKTADPILSEYVRLDNKWKAIEERIAKKMYSAVSGGTYSERSIFEEEKYLQALAVDIENKVNTENPDFFTGIITVKVEDEDVFKANAGAVNSETNQPDSILHRANYQSNYDLGAEEVKGQTATYVEDKLIPDIYRQLLVEQYILDESYDTLGRTSARHIDVLAIPKNSSYAQGAINLMNQFLEQKVFNTARTAPITLNDFKTVSRAWVGTFMDEADYDQTEEYALMNAAVPEYKYDDGANAYFKGTAYGNMMEEYEKISDNPKQSQNEASYTGSNAYSVETGKEIKVRELELKDYTSTGWYIKSVGVTGLPDSIKNQLFDINVANALNAPADKPNCVVYNAEGGWHIEDESSSKINVVGKINGQYFLRNTSRVKGTPVTNDILFENDNTYYIVLVQDAIRSTNLNKANYNQDSTAEQLDKLEEYINEIVQLVANNDTYQTLSKKHWIKKMDLKYHDTKVYDYFKSTFPELFDDDDDSSNND